MDRDLLKKILLDQEQETAILLQQSFKRLLPCGFKPVLNPRLALVITGVRRCGKSTFAHQLCRDHEDYKNHYVALNFDDERLVSFQTQDFDLLLQVVNELKPSVRLLLLDEIQNIPNWELFVNRILRKGYSCVITGSNARLLSRELSTHLTGRARTVELYPFSFQEFLSVKKSAEPLDLAFLPPEKKAQFLNLFEEYLDHGGFPEAVVHRFDPKYLRDLYDHILIRDIVSRYKLRESRTLREVALAAMSYAGERISYQKTSKSLQLNSVTTVKKYLEALEEVYLVFQVLNFSSKTKEIIRQARKLYPIDLGMLEALSLKTTPDWGARLESFVFLELKRRGYEIFSGLEIDHEVDFVIREGRKIMQLIQVCYRLSDLKTKERETRAILKAAALRRCENLLLLTHDETDHIELEGKKIQVMPAWRWALQ